MVTLSSFHSISQILPRIEVILGFSTGNLVIVATEKKGFGGAIKIKIQCSGCWITTIDYKSSQLATESRRHLVSLSLCLAFLVSGHGYASYRKTLGRGLGLATLTEKPFLEVIDLAFPHIQAILDQMCEDAKQTMKDQPQGQLGSWSRAVTTCDGCWLIRGHFSQNCTFIVKDYITSGLLYYGHLSMRGVDDICDEELWQGTAKAAEGQLAHTLWGKAKEEGMVVALNWQDGDSSSAKGFRYWFPDQQESKVMLCGGHAGRAHGKKLADCKAMHSFSSQFISLHHKEYPEVKNVKCHCLGKKHRAGCGCISDAFIQGAKRNHYCALVHAGTDPEKYRATMLTLGKFHARGIHEWKEGSCAFHPKTVCSCGDCEKNLDVEEELKCAGKPYKSAHNLTCDFHALAYEIECDNRAAKADYVIDSELGKGHSNIPESAFSVLTKFRPKDTNLHRKHYSASTNLGLIQGNMTWAYQNRGPSYHWIPDLYGRVGLPLLQGIVEMVSVGPILFVNSVRNAPIWTLHLNCIHL